jgi:oxygen-independent coproporphyrinogen-3 oxidase
MISFDDNAGLGAGTQLDLELIRKYSIPAPRYTSYPPATQFTDHFGWAQAEEAIVEDNRAGAGPLSLYFHLPFCESLCWYCGCNTVITKRREAAGEYVDDLAREVGRTAAWMDLRRNVAQVHFGGGTPTFLPPEELARLGSLIYDTYNVSPDCEFGVEIDPRSLTEAHVEALKVIGANRASLGIQDTDPQVQLAIHRWQPFEQDIQAVRWLRRAGFKSINVDLIYGLPLQTPESFSRTIDEVLALRPDRLSIFSYAHVPWLKPAQRIFETRNELPSAEAKLAMFGIAHGKLTAAGFCDIGLDHFARPDDELALAQRRGTLQRNFQGYSTLGGASLYGFGVSSISATENTYRQNFKELGEWRTALQCDRLPVERGLKLTPEDRRRRTLIMRLMCDRRLDYEALSRQLGIEVTSAYAAEIASLTDLEADGLLVRTAGGLTITPRGVPLLRIVAMRFDATFVAAPRRHAQTI